jgi:DNA-binding CsgD family transcriptional regulator
MKHDLIDVIETAYSAVPGDDAAWLKKLAEAARPALDRHGGVLAAFFDATKSDTVALSNTVSLDCDERHVRYLLESARLVGAEEIDITFRSSTVMGSAFGQIEGARPEFRDKLRKLAEEHDFVDAAVVQVADPTGFGFVFAAPVRHPWKAPRQDNARWSKVAAHLAAAYRLQRHASQHPTADPEALDQAVLTPNGKIEHAQGEASEPNSRSWLRRAALAMDRARTGLRMENTDEALSVWQGLVAGRWSLVDRFDGDGRRYLVARKNDPAVMGPAALSVREQQVVCYMALGHSNKLIAYELGLSESNVSESAKRARVKLGVRSRAELIQLLRGGGAEPRP